GLPGVEIVERGDHARQEARGVSGAARRVPWTRPAGGVVFGGRVAPSSPTRAMEPLAVLILLPVLVGIAAELLFRDASRASLAAAVVSSLAVYTCLHRLVPLGTWHGLATF